MRIWTRKSASIQPRTSLRKSDVDCAAVAERPEGELPVHGGPAAVLVARPAAADRRAEVVHDGPRPLVFAYVASYYLTVEVPFSAVSTATIARKDAFFTVDFFEIYNMCIPLRPALSERSARNIS